MPRETTSLWGVELIEFIYSMHETQQADSVLSNIQKKNVRYSIGENENYLVSIRLSVRIGGNEISDCLNFL